MPCSLLNAALLAVALGAPDDSPGEDLAPVVESSRPDGYPTLTATGKIEVKSYPATRLARATLEGPGELGRNLLFWKLFNHIKKHDIGMTAPVVMTYGNEEPSVSMSFVYRSTEIGAAGADGDVEVLDVPAVRVASLGMRGGYTRARYEEGVGKLRAWLDANAEWEAVGEPRILAYNSPRVPPARRFSEVQIPIRAAGEKTRSF